VLADTKNQALRCSEPGGQGSPGAAIEPASVSILAVKHVGSVMVIICRSKVKLQLRKE